MVADPQEPGEGATGGTDSTREAAGAIATDAEWQAHPTVNSPHPCPWCGIRSLHEQHCKQICLACGWYQSCVD